MTENIDRAPCTTPTASWMFFATILEVWHLGVAQNREETHRTSIKASDKRMTVGPTSESYKNLSLNQ